MRSWGWHLRKGHWIRCHCDQVKGKRRTYWSTALPKPPQKGAKFPGMHEVCKYLEICKGKCSLMISMNSPEVYETGSLNIRRECVCWLTGDAVAASTWRCSITANISVIPGCYIKRLAVSPWIGQEVSGGLCSAPVKGPHMPLLSSFRKWRTQQTQWLVRHEYIFWLKKRVDRLERPEQTASRRVSPACLHMLPEGAQISELLHCMLEWKVFSSAF